MVPLLIVPESATLNVVLRRFQLGKRHMAIVVDEYGSTQGIVTMEDVLEEIVGEIQDEYDDEGTVLREEEDGRVIAEGRISIHDLYSPGKTSEWNFFRHDRSPWRIVYDGR